LLLSRGANVNAQTKDGITTLCAATEKGYVKVIEALLEYNADVNSTVKTGVTPLHIAAEKGHLEILEVLLKFGADIDSKDEFGRTLCRTECTALDTHNSLKHMLPRHCKTFNDVFY
jgi:ankyrin repeat protein